MFDLRYLSGVVTLSLDREKCTGCKMCTKVCPHAVFAIEDHEMIADPGACIAVPTGLQYRKARIVDRDACMECGACAGNCPEAAISVESGVGCAAAILTAAISGGKPNCDCSNTC